MQLSILASLLALAGTTLVQAAPVTSDIWGAVGAPAPRAAAGLKQTSRDEILRRNARPARRALISTSPPPQSVNQYDFQGAIQGARAAAAPSASKTYVSSLDQNDVITQCLNTAGYPTEMAYVYFNSAQDVWYCDYYQTPPEGGVTDPDVQWLYGYEYTGGIP